MEAAINKSQRAETIVVLGLLLAGAALLALQPSDSSTSSTFPPTKPDTITDRDAPGSKLEPSEKGWFGTARRVYTGINEHRILLIAAGVTFYILLALFPAIAGLVSLYGLFTDPTTLSEHLSKLSGLLPQGALDIIGEQIKRVSANSTGTLGLAFFTGLGIAMWSANAGMKSMFDALNIVYGERERRGFVQFNLQSLGFTFGSVLFILLALGAIVVLPFLSNLLGGSREGFGGLNLIGWLRWPALLAVVLLALAVLYRYGPSHTRGQWRWVTWGSIIAGVAWLGSSMLFSWYVANFGTYNQTYGSLGAAIGFMTWMWLSAFIVLSGAQINAEIEREEKMGSSVTP